MELAVFLEFIRAKDRLQSLYKKMQRELTRETDHVWVRFVGLLVNHLVEEIATTESELLWLEEHANHPWLREGLVWMRMKNIFISRHRLQAEPVIDLEMVQTPWWRIQVLFLFTDYARARGEWGKLAHFIGQMTFTAKAHKLSIVVPFIHACKGNLLISQGYLEKASTWYEKALEGADLFNLVSLRNSVSNSLGVLNNNLGKYGLAERYFLTALENDTTDLSKVTHLNNLGLNSLGRGELWKALHYYEQSEKLLSTYSDLTRMHGYLKMGLGLVQASQGRIEEAEVLFGEAFNLFQHFSNNLAQTYLHGTVGRLYSDLGSTIQAQEHFKEFLKLLNHTQAYQNFFPQYSSYVLFLIEQKKREDEVEEHLTQLKTIASQHSSNSLVNSWLDFVCGVYQMKELNISLAQSRLERVLSRSLANDPIDLTLRTILQLTELHIQRYILVGQQKSLDEVEYLLNIAEEVGASDPIYPLSIFIKVFQAMLAKHKGREEDMERFILEASDLLSTTGFQPILEHKVQLLINQVHNLSPVPSEFSRSLAAALRISRHHISPPTDVVGLVAWKFSKRGPVPFLDVVPTNLVSEEEMASFTMVMGSMFFTLIGQGDNYFEGTYGPLPVPVGETTRVHCLLVSRKVKDRTQQDPRLADKNFLVLGLVYPEEQEVDRLVVQEILKGWWDRVDDLSDLELESLVILRDKLATALM